MHTCHTFLHLVWQVLVDIWYIWTSARARVHMRKLFITNIRVTRLIYKHTFGTIYAHTNRHTNLRTKSARKQFVHTKNT